MILRVGGQALGLKVNGHCVPLAPTQLQAPRPYTQTSNARLPFEGPFRVAVENLLSHGIYKSLRTSLQFCLWVPSKHPSNLRLHAPRKCCDIKPVDAFVRTSVRNFVVA